VDDRSADLRQIHALQRQLGLSADDASALKLTLTGVASSGDMSAPQRAKLLAHLRKLVHGSAAGCGAARSALPRAKVTRARPALSQLQKLIWALWQQLADAGKVEDRRATALAAYIKRQSGVDQLSWLQGAQAAFVVESLKKWLAR
jgi:hypothetical protein